MLSAMTGFAAAVTTGSTLRVRRCCVGLDGSCRSGGLRRVRLGVSQIAVGFVLTILAIDLSDYLGTLRWCGGTRRALAQHPGAVRDPSARPSALLAEHRGLRQLSTDHRGSALPIQHSERAGAARRRRTARSGLRPRDTRDPISRPGHDRGGALVGVAGAAFSSTSSWDGARVSPPTSAGSHWQSSSLEDGTRCVPPSAPTGVLRLRSVSSRSSPVSPVLPAPVPADDPHPGVDQPALVASSHRTQPSAPGSWWPAGTVGAGQTLPP